MSIAEIEDAITRLPKPELDALSQWFEEYLADQWDQQLVADAASGRLDAAARKADADIDAGRCNSVSGAACGPCWLPRK